MSWELTGLVSRKKWGGQTRRLLALTMSDKANDDGSGVYASVRTLARDSEISEATARRALQGFESEGVVAKVGQRACLNGYTNVYQINVAAIEAMEDLKPAKRAETPVTVRPVAPRKGSRNDTPDTETPLAPRYQTPVTVTDKPILEPTSLTLTTFELETAPVEKPKAKSAKKACKPTPYTPHFQMIWLAWPKHKRGTSDKRMAFRRYQTGVAQFGADAVWAAAERYLSLPDTRKEQWRYCCAVEVFMNGKLEAAVEAALDVEQPHETATHEDAERRSAQRYFDKHGRWPQGYHPPLAARQ